MTGSNGSILERTILGNRLLVGRDEVGAEKDVNTICYVDLPLKRTPTSDK